MGDQGKVPEKNPYEVSAIASADRTQQPTALQIIGAVILAIIAGMIVFFITCLGTMVAAFEFPETRERNAAREILIVVGGGVVGTIAVSLTIYRTYRSLIMYQTTGRNKRKEPVHKESGTRSQEEQGPESDASDRLEWFEGIGE